MNNYIKPAADTINTQQTGQKRYIDHVNIWRRAGCSRLENLLHLVEILSRCSEIRWGTWWGHGGTWWGHGLDK